MPREKKGDTETTHSQTVAWMATTNEKEIIPYFKKVDDR